MWQVSDPSTHAAFLAALAQSHTYTPTVKTYLDGVELGTVLLQSGRIRVSGRTQVRRRAYLTVPESQWTDQLSAYGVELRAWVTVAAGNITYPPVPVFTGRVERRERSRRSGLVQVECWDRFAAINDDAFETPRATPAGARIADATATLIKETHPSVAVTDLTGLPSTVPAGLTWDLGDGSRGLAIDRMALAIGAEIVALPDGNFLQRLYPTLTDEPAWQVATGPGGVIVADAQVETRTGVANRWIITGNQTAAGVSVREVATIIGGTLRYGGPYGRVVRYHTDPMITSTVQASQVGAAILARVEGMARQRIVTVIANPALEAGDVLAVSTADGLELHIADEFDVPLTADIPTMAVASRSTVDV